MRQGFLRFGLMGVLLLPGVSGVGQEAAAGLRIRQAHLEGLCLDGTSVQPTVRRWKLPPGPHTLSVTMRNDPREGVASADPGTATIAFSLEAGHQYDVEVRAPATAYSARVWKKADWIPVVRDRSAEQTVGADPDWNAPSCR